ncbi:MAG TPA: hybrid sensor histidine kinase/response regulator [Terriglobales bacterium]|nr:hybrid sensor histidine kinase/response regulator [Terriglobales bacterium]
MVSPVPKILVVDDERNVLLTVQAILQQEGYDVDAVGDGASAVRAIHDRHYDLVLTDLKMPGLDGLAVLREVQQRSPDTVTVMMTGYGSVGTAVEAVQAGALEYLLKPTEVPDLKAAVRRALERKRLSEIDTLYRVTRTVTSSLNVDDICREVADSVRRVLRVQNACVVAFDSARAPQCPSPLDELLRDRAILERLQSGGILTADDLAPWAAAQKIRACALVPGLANDRLVTVLYADNAATPYSFHLSALRFLQALSAQTALALANASLVEELQRNNDELASANEKLRQLDRLKSQFLSVATHELRTPLSIILGYNSMLSESLEDRLNDEEKETLREAIGACKRLIRLVNSMLDISQIESGKMRMNFEIADLRRIVNGVVALFQNEARLRQISLRVEVPQRLPRLKLDSERIEQVLVNLVGNAVKFTSAGGSITVSVRSRDQQVEVAVADTGAGIAPEEQAHLFDEFVQVRRHRGRKQGEGSGLGLAIARRIVEAHHGHLSFISRLGEGSTFRFVLPTEASHTTTVSAVSA